MIETVRPLVGPVIALFVVTAMFSLGLELTARQIAEPLRDRRLMTRAMGSNLVVVPLYAYALTLLIPLEEPLRVGFILYAICMGSEGAPKFVQIARGNAGFAVGLLAFLLAATVIFVPWALGAVVPDVHLPRGKLLLKLLLVVALPLGAGLLIKARRAEIAARISPAAHRLAMLLMFTGVAMIVYVNFARLLSLDPRAVLAGMLFFAFAMGTGYLAGGPRKEGRRALAIMTFARNGGIAMMIAGQAFTHEPEVIVMVTAMSVLSLLLVIPASLAFRHVGAGEAVISPRQRAPRASRPRGRSP